jgi:hypothetical protein
MIAVPTNQPSQALKQHNYHFPTLLAGLEYQKYCPICDSKLDPPGIEYRHSQNGTSKILIWESRLDEMITIDLQTQNITITQSTRDYNFGGHTYKSPSISNMVGRALSIDCPYYYCMHYGFTLGVEFYADGTLSTVLNGEWIESDGLGLSNLYRNPRSRFYYWNQNKGRHLMSKVIELPLIPINLQNPQESLLRAKNLVAFL